MSETLEFEVFTIFPGAIEAFVGAGLMAKAIERELVAVHCTDLRAFTTDRHRSVDDAPFGGGAGMVIKAEPVAAALDSVREDRGAMHTILLTPSGDRFDQRVAERLARKGRIALLCGRYEGIDDRIREHFVDECLSIGDFVLNGGEVAAAAIIEAVARLREGVLGNPDSIAHESFAEVSADADADADPQTDSGWTAGLVLEHPHYTRPASFRGHAIPAVLLGGDHGAIERWRRRVACLRTWALRPELRPRWRLPGDQPIWLAVPGELEPSEVEVLGEIAATGLPGAVTILVALGPRNAAAPVHMRDLKQLRKHVGKHGGKDGGKEQRDIRSPWVLGVGEAEADEPELGPRLILDVLAFEANEGPPGLILWLGRADHPAVAKRGPDAWLALEPERDVARSPDRKTSPARLALASGLIDISQPRAARRPVVHLARLALAALERDGLLG